MIDTTDDRALKIGWLGLGAMGSPMATVAAAAGHHVTAYDLDPSRADDLADQGVGAAGSPAEAAAHADVLVLMVATPAQGEAALFGDDGHEGAAAGLRDGSTVLVMSTVGVSAVQTWEERLSEKGVGVVDAPVSGGVRRAADGDLLVMVSGPPAEVARVDPLLHALAGNHPVVGDEVGDGQKVKLVNQLLAGVHIAAAAEALALAETLGLDPRACWEVLRHGAAASFMLSDRGDRMTVPGGSDAVNSALDIFVKDMGLVLDAGSAAGARVPLAETAQRLYAEGADRGMGRLDDSQVIRLLSPEAAEPTEATEATGATGATGASDGQET